MGDVIIVGNTKGGVGKTALTFNLAHGFSELGLRTLAVDLDVQCGLTAFLRDAPPDADHDAAAALTGRCDIDDALHHVGDRLDVLPAEEYSMAFVTRRLETDAAVTRARVLLAAFFDRLRDRWEVTIVDTAGHQSPFLALAVEAADGVIVPISPEAGPVAELETTLNVVEAQRSDRLADAVLGVVRTRVWGNAVYRRVAEDRIRTIAASRNVRVFRNKIPEDAKFGEAHLLGLAVDEHQPRARSAVAYRYLAAEVAEHAGWRLPEAAV